MAPQTVVALDNMTAYTNIAANAFTPGEVGYYYTGWGSTESGEGAKFTDDQFVGLIGNLDLYAQWSNLYTIRYRHTNHTNLMGDDETGHQECYALKIGGVMMRKLGKFSEDSGDVYSYPYGTLIEVAVNDYNGGLFYKDIDADIYYNGVSKACGQPAYWSFNLACNVDIEFRWKIAGSVISFNAQSWEDCYITTY
jgi:uncharacterized repeat protein (TIGR02543 family)